MTPPPFNISDRVVALQSYTQSPHTCVLEGSTQTITDVIWRERHQRWTVALANKFEEYPASAFIKSSQ